MIRDESRESGRVLNTLTPHQLITPKTIEYTLLMKLKMQQRLMILFMAMKRRLITIIRQMITRNTFLDVTLQYKPSNSPTYKSKNHNIIVSDDRNYVLNTSPISISLI